jgi:hypothetical protein
VYIKRPVIVVTAIKNMNPRIRKYFSMAASWELTV